MVLPRRGARVPPLPTPGLRGAPSAGRRPGTRTCGPRALRLPAGLPHAPHISPSPPGASPSLPGTSSPRSRPPRGPPGVPPAPSPRGPRSLPSLLYSLLSPAPPSLPTLSRLSRDERAPGGVLLLRRPGEGTSRARGRPGPTWERRAASRGHPGAPGRPRGSPKATAPSHDLGSHPPPRVGSSRGHDPCAMLLVLSGSRWSPPCGTARSAGGASLQAPQSAVSLWRDSALAGQSVAGEGCGRWWGEGWLFVELQEKQHKWIFKEMGGGERRLQRGEG